MMKRFLGAILVFFQIFCFVSKLMVKICTASSLQILIIQLFIIYIYIKIILYYLKSTVNYSDQSFPSFLVLSDSSRMVGKPCTTTHGKGGKCIFSFEKKKLCKDLQGLTKSSDCGENRYLRCCPVEIISKTNIPPPTSNFGRLIELFWCCCMNLQFN